MNPILAQPDRSVYLRSMHQHFATPNPHLWWEILLGVVVIGAVIGLVVLCGAWQRSRSSRGELGPLSLYRRVLKAARLPLGDTWRLWRLAQVVRPPHPTALLLSRELYDEAVAQYCAGRNWLQSRAGAAPVFAEIRRRLFDE